MRKSKGKIVSILIISLGLIALGLNTYAHSGRTDSSGGHRDNKNRSGLGGYHYHCGGHPAHLHSNGVCPYSSSYSYSSTKINTDVDVRKIEINEEIKSIEVGESETLTAKITPSNATDKDITWESNDEDVATVNSKGKVVAKKAGTVKITASCSNGKKSTIKIKIIEKEIVDETSVNKVTTLGVTNTINDIDKDDQEDLNESGSFLGYALLAAGGYWVYKKASKK